MFMKKLLDYFNALDERERQEFLKQTELSDGSKITEGYLRKACSRGERLKGGYCVSIERATNGAVTRKDLRPNDWHEIWPELAEKEDGE